MFDAEAIKIVSDCCKTERIQLVGDICWSFDPDGPSLDPEVFGTEGQDGQRWHCEECEMFCMIQVIPRQQLRLFD